MDAPADGDDADGRARKQAKKQVKCERHARRRTEAGEGADEGARPGEKRTERTEGEGEREGEGVPTVEDARAHKKEKRKHRLARGEGEGADEGAGEGEDEPSRAAPAPPRATALVAAPQRTAPASNNLVVVAAAAGPRRARVQGVRSWKEDKVLFKRGKFSLDEHEALRRAIEAQLRAHPGNFATVEDFGTNAKKGEWMDICSALPERTLLSCYEYCRRHFHEGNYKGAWTDEEVTRLRRLQSQYGNTWKVIAEELRRERTNVRDKWRELEMPGRVTGAWSDEENAQLLKLISDACSADVQLMGSEGAIPWAVIAAQMGRRSAKQCRTAWKRLSQTAGSGLPGSEMDAFDFVSALYHSAVRDPSEVTWENFGRNAHRRFQLLCKSVDSGDAAPFRARVIALYRSFESPTAGDGGGGDESS